MVVQTGDNVIYSKYAGTEVALEGADYVLLKVSGEARRCSQAHLDLARPWLADTSARTCRRRMLLVC